MTTLVMARASSTQSLEILETLRSGGRPAMVKVPSTPSLGTPRDPRSTGYPGESRASAFSPKGRTSPVHMISGTGYEIPGAHRVEGVRRSLMGPPPGSLDLIPERVVVKN